MRVGKATRLPLESLLYQTDMFRSIVKSVSMRRLYCDVLIGLADPADTAMVSGYLWSLASAVNVSPEFHMSVTPDFSSERLDGSIAAELKFRLLWVVVALVGALTKKPVRQLFRGMRT